MKPRADGRPDNCPNRSKRLLALSISAAMMGHLTTGAGAADMNFHVEVIEQQDEVSPLQDSHLMRHETYFYVTDEAVYIEDDRLDIDNVPVPFDTPSERTSRYGTRLTNTFHRIEGGIEAISEYESFFIDRRIVQVDEKTCAASITATLKPGHDYFELRRRTDHDLMYLSALTYVSVKCEVPKLVG